MYDKRCRNKSFICINNANKQNMKTKIYKSYADFLMRENKEENGVSVDFAAEHPDFEEDNKTNIDCWNCYDCKNCESCNLCISCISCISCYWCKNCELCEHCYSCESSYNCSFCKSLESCESCEFLKDYKGGKNL